MTDYPDWTKEDHEDSLRRLRELTHNPNFPKLKQETRDRVLRLIEKHENEMKKFGKKPEPKFSGAMSDFYFSGC